MAAEPSPSIISTETLQTKGFRYCFSTHNIRILVISNLSINRIAKNVCPANVLETESSENTRARLPSPTISDVFEVLRNLENANRKKRLAC